MLFTKNAPTLVVLGLTTFLAMGSISIQEIKSKSDVELLELLSSSDSATRCACLMALGFRFRNPDTPVILGPALAQEAHSQGTPMPNGLLERTAALAKSDSDLKVRVAAVMALSSFKFRTNTSQVLATLLEDRSCIIKIRAAQALIGFVDDRSH